MKIHGVIKNSLDDIKYRRKIKTLPEAQRTQGIEFITQIICYDRNQFHIILPEREEGYFRL